MKKIILLLVFQFTALMAITYNVTNDGQMIPVTEDQSSTTEVTETPTTPTSQTTGSAETNWGFQPFTVPSGVVNVPAGGNIQAAIDSLPNGGTINLAAGTYYVNRLEFNQNMVIQGAGIGKTILKHASGARYISYVSGNDHGGNYKNLILRDFSVDASLGERSMTFNFGVSNLLFENLNISNATTSGLSVKCEGRSTRGKNVTFRNLEIHHNGQHALAVEFIEGVIIENSYFHDLTGGDGGYAMDLSKLKYAEIANVTVKDTAYGSKFPSCNYMYMHDTTFIRAGHTALKLQEGQAPQGNQYLHLENVTVDDSGQGIMQIGDPIGAYTFEQIVVKNVTLTNNDLNSNQKVRVKGANYVYEYNNGIGMVYASAGTLTNVVQRTTGTPEDDNVGWTSWPALQQ